MSVNEYSTASTLGRKFNMPRFSILRGRRRRKKLFRKKIKKIHFTRKILPVFGEKRKTYLIIEDDHDFTPKPLYDSYYRTVNEKAFTQLPFLRVSNKLRSESRVSIVSHRSKTSTIFNVSRGTMESSYCVDMLSRFSMSGMSYESEEILLEDDAPSMFILREDPPPSNPAIPRKFNVHLRETDTFSLLSIKSTAYHKDSETAKDIVSRNSIYGKNIATTKSISQTATQTASTANVRKKKSSLISSNRRQNAQSFASVWDIYDTYKELETVRLSKLVVSEENKIDKLTTVTDDKDSLYKRVSYHGTSLGINFLDTVLIMERLISAYSYKEKQLSYQGLFQQDPFSLDLVYNYTLKLLWTFRENITKDKVVTSISLSPTNDNIIAVGYGKFKYSDNKSGFVCCWNIKNPTYPERSYQFEQPVTCVRFSKHHPNILAVSFYSGLLNLLDVTKVYERIIASNNIYPLFHPVRKVCWFSNEDGYSEDFPVTCGKDGRIFKYRKTEFFTSKSIQSVSRVDGKLQGSDQPRKCYPTKVLVSRHPSAECMVPHPTDPVMYYVGTSEGNVYKCSINYCHHHLEVFVAHNGPIYGIEFHPFSPKIFLTYGGDWCIKVWAEGVFEPLITLISGMQAVEAAVWHPLNSTIIVSITGKCIEMWDIRRKTIHPKSSTMSPSRSFNTALQFTKNGYNICVGDEDGNVHVLALAEMPFSPEFQEAVLVKAIKKALISKPDLLTKLAKLGPPFQETDRQNKLYRNLERIYKG